MVLCPASRLQPWLWPAGMLAGPRLSPADPAMRMKRSAAFFALVLSRPMESQQRPDSPTRAPAVAPTMLPAVSRQARNTRRRVPLFCALTPATRPAHRQGCGANTNRQPGSSCGPSVRWARRRPRTTGMDAQHHEERQPSERWPSVALAIRPGLSTAPHVPSQLAVRRTTCTRRRTLQRLAALWLLSASSVRSPWQSAGCALTGLDRRMSGPGIPIKPWTNRGRSAWRRKRR